MDETLLRSKTATRLIIIIEDLLEIIPKGVRCPAVSNAHTALKAHSEATKKKFNNVKPSRIRQVRIDNILSYRNIDMRYEHGKTAGTLELSGGQREERDIISKVVGL